jgi:hypothetical protein
MVAVQNFKGEIIQLKLSRKGGGATVFLHAHLQVVYYNCVKFHKKSISSLVGVALTRYTHMQIKIYEEFYHCTIIPPCKQSLGGI